MKTSIKTIAATIALTALMAGPASAVTKFEGDVSQDVLSAGQINSNLFFDVDNNGSTASFSDEQVPDATIQVVKPKNLNDQFVDSLELPK